MNRRLVLFASSWRLILLVAVTCFGSFELATAQDGLAIDMLKTKAAMEDIISTSIRQRIQTTLGPELFTTSVSVKLRPILQPKSESGSQTIPATEPSPDLGVLRAETLIRVYEERLEASRAQTGDRATSTAVNADKFAVVGVHIHVGLSDKLDSAYKKKFEAWLKGQIKLEFGSLGLATINTLAPSPKDESTASNKSPTAQAAPSASPANDPAWFTTLRDLQVLAGLALIALGFIVAILFFKRLPSKDLEDQQRVVTQIESKQYNAIAASHAASAAGGSEADSTPKSGSLTGLISTEGLTVNSAAKESEYATKLRLLSIALHMQNQFGAVVASWLTRGESGAIRTAVLIDSLVSHGGAKSREVLELITSLNIPIESHAILNRTLRRVKEMSIDERAKWLVDAYWELLPAKLVGLNATLEPFEYLKDLDRKGLARVIDGQPSAIRNAILLSMDDKDVPGLVSSLSGDVKRELIVDALEQSSTDITELLTLSETLRSRLNPQGKKSKIEKPGLVLTAFSALTVPEELMIISHLYDRHPDKLDAIAPQVVSVGLMGLWKDSVAADYLSRLTPDLVYALMQLLPQLQTKILQNVASLTKQIVEDDLAIQKMLSQKEFDEKMIELKSALHLFQKESGIEPADFYAPTAPSIEGSHAA